MIAHQYAILESDWKERIQKRNNKFQNRPSADFEFYFIPFQIFRAIFHFVYSFEVARASYNVIRRTCSISLRETQETCAYEHRARATNLLKRRTCSISLRETHASCAYELPAPASKLIIRRTCRISLRETHASGRYELRALTNFLC